MQRPFQQVNLITGEPTRTFNYIKDNELEQILTRSHLAFLQAKNSLIDERIEKAQRFADLIESQPDELRTSISKDGGCPLMMATGQITKSALVCRFFASKLQQYLQDEPIEAENGIEATLKYEPLGIVCIVAPFNVTIFSFAYIVMPQLLAGNAVIYKPDENNFTTSLIIKQLADQAGFGDQYQVGAFTFNQIDRILQDDRVCGLQFTGSTQVGKHLGSIAARNLKIVSLELGSIDPMFVLADGNQIKAIQCIAKYRFSANGQVCNSPKRVYVQEDIYDEFIEKLVNEARKYTPQDPFVPDCNMGPLARKDILDKAIRQTQASVADGASLLIGGDSPGGQFMNPTVLVDVPRNATCFIEEIFGPVVSVAKFSNINEIVEIANDCNFGLYATIWTQQTDIVEREIVPRIQNGSVMVNALELNPAGTFGGVKDSGIGRQGCYYGIRKFMNLKAVVMNSRLAQ